MPSQRSEKPTEREYRDAFRQVAQYVKEAKELKAAAGGDSAMTPSHLEQRTSRTPLRWEDVTPGQTIEVKISAPMFPQVDGEWERRRVIAVAWPEITLRDGDREYVIDAVEDRARLIRDPFDPCGLCGCPADRFDGHVCEEEVLAKVERAARAVHELIGGDVGAWKLDGRKVTEDAGLALISLTGYLNDLDYVRGGSRS